MDLIETLRTTGAVREFTDEAVSDDALRRALDTARFAPSGGNRQGWRVVVVRDPAIRRGLRDLYLPGWYEYLGQRASGLVPYAPTNAADAEAAARAKGDEIAAASAQGPGGFGEHLDDVPVLLAVLADLGALAAVDKDLDRYTFAGGASVYPFVWNLLLAARAEGLAGTITTMVARKEPEVLRLLGAPSTYAVAALLALGHPVKQPTKLTRAALESFTTVDRCDGPAF